MKKKLTAYFSKPQKNKKNIHQQIEETLAERRKILPQWERIFLQENPDTQKDIHAQLKETIAAFKLSMREHKSFFIKQNKNAA